MEGGRGNYSSSQATLCSVCRLCWAGENCFEILAPDKTQENIWAHGRGRTVGRPHEANVG